MEHRREDPIPCPICGGDIDPQLLHTEHALFGTDEIKILEGIAEWGCFAVPGWTHSHWKWEEALPHIRDIHARLKGDMRGIQHAWVIVRPTITPTYSPYCWVPERLRERSLRPITR